MQKNLSLDKFVAEQENGVLTRLQQASGVDEAEDGSNLTGIEVLAFLAGKIVVPIVCGFVSRWLYEKYANIGKRKELDEAKVALAVQSYGSSPAVPVEVVRAEALRRLANEGVPLDIAAATVDEVIQHCQQRFSSA
ncbi:hypothetical protein [Nannocystis sp. SCPEA4]|uniref:hypothetical protein n=1 Tax=Nannocystis sp. SCPEA4 TaxID=2996787 RepID=UPI00226F117C|nr:hypothetical protein [Nannocystis sp. SCPEA4]MCY1058934.1 hypothetical protein [Nannocystis sp. SCPEA4]